MTNKVMKGGVNNGTSLSNHSGSGSGPITKADLSVEDRKIYDDNKYTQETMTFTSLGTYIKYWKKIIVINVDQGWDSVFRIIDDIFENRGIVTDKIIQEHNILSESNCRIMKNKEDLDLKKCNFCIGFLLPSNFRSDKDRELDLVKVVDHMVYNYYKNDTNTYKQAYEEMCKKIQVSLLVNKIEDNVRLYKLNPFGNRIEKDNGEVILDKNDKIDYAHVYIDNNITLINLTKENEINYYKIKSKQVNLTNDYTHVKLIHGNDFNILLQDMSLNKTEKKVYVFLAQNTEHKIYCKSNWGGIENCYYNDIPYYKYKITYDNDGNKTYEEFKVASEKDFGEKFSNLKDRYTAPNNTITRGGKTRKHRKRKMRSSKRKANKKGRKSRKKNSSSRKKK